MLFSILSTGLAMGAIYALIGVTYNTMYATSRVMSFTAGQLGMLGGVFGSLFILKLGLPWIVGLALTLAACALVGVVTEIIAVRPVLKSIEQHLYVLSTLALALMIQQVTAMMWNSALQDVPLYVLLLLFIAFRPTGFFPLVVTISEPESPPALNEPSLTPIWLTNRATPSDAQKNRPRGL
jgi:branched-subunit amino acid ABC-type transport system permease component